MQKAYVLLLIIFWGMPISCAPPRSSQAPVGHLATGKGIWADIYNLFPEKVGSMVKSDARLDDSDTVHFFNADNKSIGHVSLMGTGEEPETYAGWSSSVYYSGEAFGFIMFSYGLYLLREFPWDTKQWTNVTRYNINGFNVIAGFQSGFFYRRIVRVDDNFIIAYGSSDEANCTQFFDKVLEGIDYKKLKSLLDAYSLPTKS